MSSDPSEFPIEVVDIIFSFAIIRTYIRPNILALSKPYRDMARKYRYMSVNLNAIVKKDSTISIMLDKVEELIFIHSWICA
jgi:hypothetical protein